MMAFSWASIAHATGFWLRKSSMAIAMEAFGDNKQRDLEEVIEPHES
jgi:hypothetical protein